MSKLTFSYNIHTVIKPPGYNIISKWFKEYCSKFYMESWLEFIQNKMKNVNCTIIQDDEYEVLSYCTISFNSEEDMFLFLMEWS